MSIEDQWQWCNKCQGMTFAGQASMGACPAGGQHGHAGSGDYAFVLNDAAVPGQHNWRWCKKCQALCFAGGASPGACSGGGSHDHTGNGNYVVWQQPDGTLGQHNWRWCNKCQVLTFAGSATPGACAAGGTHSHVGSGDYVLPQVTGCAPLLHTLTTLEQEVAALQSAPGYTQGPHDPKPGKPDAEALGEIKALQQQVGAASAAYQACGRAQTRSVLNTVCDSTRCVSIDAVYANIAARLDGKVVGYSCSVGRSLTYQSHGSARTNADAPARDFLSSTKIPVASVSKIITALTAIRVLGKHGVSLDAAIGPHVPPDWVLDPSVAAITFRQLLGQKSGIKDYGDVQQDYDGVKAFFTQSVDLTKNTQCTGALAQIIADPINPKNKTWCYSNWNFVIFRVLLPYIDGFVDFTSQRGAKLAAAYVKLAQHYVFEPVGAFGVDGKPPASGPQASAYAFGYAWPGAAGGTDWGDDTAAIGAAGWYLSVEDMANVLGSLNADDGRVLAAAQRADMEATQLGWDNLADATKYRWVEKNGGWGGGNGSLISTSIALFGPGVLGVLFMNSDIAGEPNVRAATVLHDAYMKALTPRP